MVADGTVGKRNWARSHTLKHAYNFFRKKDLGRDDWGSGSHWYRDRDSEKKIVDAGFAFFALACCYFTNKLHEHETSLKSKCNEMK